MPRHRQPVLSRAGPRPAPPRGIVAQGDPLCQHFSARRRQPGAKERPRGGGSPPAAPGLAPIRSPYGEPDGLTIRVSGSEVLPLKFASPLYTAVMTCIPTASGGKLPQPPISMVNRTVVVPLNVS